MKRMFPLVIAMIGAMVVALAPASPASAHPGFHVIVLEGSMSITDEDWPDSDDYGFKRFSGVINLPPTATSGSARFEGCADEVRVVLEVVATHSLSLFADGRVVVTTRTKLYEGASCATTDLELSVARSMTVPAYATKSDNWTVNASGNSSGLVLTVRNAV
ncbi:MAG TPA: hypothetical protein VES42_17390 [Pilimelia sp.]|nr:hypothetical protein [Pilimelia sp.]